MSKALIDVFISYAAEDANVAEAICRDLEAGGIRCWMAPRDVLPGKPFPEQIVSAIRRSGMMVLVFSSSSNQSGHVRNELNIAVEADLGVLPFWIDDFEVSESMRYYVGTAHWFDARTSPLETHSEELIRTVKRVLSSAHTAYELESLPLCEGEQVSNEVPLVPIVPVKAGRGRWVVPICIALALAAVTWVVWPPRKTEVPDSPESASAPEPSKGTGAAGSSRPDTQFAPVEPTTADLRSEIPGTAPLVEAGLDSVSLDVVEMTDSSGPGHANEDVRANGDSGPHSVSTTEADSHHDRLAEEVTVGEETEPGPLQPGRRPDSARHDTASLETEALSQPRDSDADTGRRSQGGGKTSRRAVMRKKDELPSQPMPDPARSVPGIRFRELPSERKVGSHGSK